MKHDIFLDSFSKYRTKSSVYPVSTLYQENVCWTRKRIRGWGSLFRHALHTLNNVLVCDFGLYFMTRPLHISNPLTHFAHVTSKKVLNLILATTKTGWHISTLWLSAFLSQCFLGESQQKMLTAKGSSYITLTHVLQERLQNKDLMKCINPLVHPATGTGGRGALSRTIINWSLPHMALWVQCF